MIKDQIHHLSKNGINGKTLNHKMSQKERAQVFADLKSKEPKTCLLYVTPELCLSDTFQNMIMLLNNREKLAYIVVDEAHCIASWGSTFRPDYNKLGDLRPLTANVPWIALTATANKDVETEIIRSLGFKESYKRFKLPTYRSNLIYDVVFKDPNLENVSN